ncbi:hypothetical protein [Streptomyces halobius]|uniref:Uncharacterized protein n=1 Tax=Streptomyces halobius TaxID=2879846 RepID=A0ABY4MDQ8_9ACTN|nr:hypothetical protein [Streptomyces halobius]UQA95527.1 hypothetical protein K9S39_30010 [Streptomyces halobius]
MPPDLAFSMELRPISEDFVPQAPAVSGLDRDRLPGEAPSAESAMAAAASWATAEDAAEPAHVFEAVVRSRGGG